MQLQTFLMVLQESCAKNEIKNENKTARIFLFIKLLPHKALHN